MIHGKENAYIIELSCVFITSVEETSIREQNSYNAAIDNLRRMFKTIEFINLTMNALGLLGKNESEPDIITVFSKLGLKPRQTVLFIMICICSTYSLFCREYKDWQDRELLILKPLRILFYTIVTAVSVIPKPYLVSGGYS